LEKKPNSAYFVFFRSAGSFVGSHIAKHLDADVISLAGMASYSEYRPLPFLNFRVLKRGPLFETGDLDPKAVLESMGTARNRRILLLLPKSDEILGDGVLSSVDGWDNKLVQVDGKHSILPPKDAIKDFMTVG
jgi:hypothetical protein